MRIRYSVEHNAFMMRDLNTGFGTFCRIEQPTLLEGNQLVSVGDCFLLIQAEVKQEKPAGLF